MFPAAVSQSCRAGSSLPRFFLPLFYFLAFEGNEGNHPAARQEQRTLVYFSFHFLRRLVVFGFFFCLFSIELKSKSGRKRRPPLALDRFGFLGDLCFPTVHSYSHVCAFYPV